MFFLLLVAVVSLTCVFFSPVQMVHFIHWHAPLINFVPLLQLVVIYFLCIPLGLHCLHWKFWLYFVWHERPGAPWTTEITPQAINASRYVMICALNCRGGAMCNQESPAHEFLRKNPIMYRVHADGVPFPPARQLPRRTCSSSRKNMFKTDNSNGKKWRLYHGNEG